jgi:hypothetical protein
VRVWNARNLRRPQQVAEIHPDQTCHSVHNVYGDGRFVYAAWYNQGIEVYCVEDPTRPVRCGYYHHPTRWRAGPLDTCCDPTGGAETPCFGVPHLDPFFPSGIFIATEVNGGLLVGRFQPQAVGTSPPEQGDAGEIRLLGAPGELPVRLAWRPWDLLSGAGLAGAVGRAPDGEGGREDDGTSLPRGGAGGAGGGRPDGGPALEIFSPGGSRVARLEPERHDPEHGYVYRWDGADASSRRLPAGIYFVRGPVGAPYGAPGAGIPRKVLLLP